jgi:hypothetical protein
MPNSPEDCTMLDIDVVQRIFEYFLMHEKQQMQLQQKSGKLNRLMDNYLAEVATDPNLSITKFQVLAELLPEYTRSLDDGLYRAIDTYLKVCLLILISCVSSLKCCKRYFKTKF